MRDAIENSYRLRRTKTKISFRLHLKNVKYLEVSLNGLQGVPEFVSTNFSTTLYFIYSGVHSLLGRVCVVMFPIRGKNKSCRRTAALGGYDICSCVRVRSGVCCVYMLPGFVCVVLLPMRWKDKVCTRLIACVHRLLRRVCIMLFDTSKTIDEFTHFLLACYLFAGV